MSIYKKTRRSIADFFRARPKLYDWARQFRLRALGPISRIGQQLDHLTATHTRDFRFLQIGASDGLRNDPLRDFIVRDRWSGVFVEPLPDAFALLKSNYKHLAQKQNLAFLNAAVSSDSASLPFHTFQESYLAGKPLEERLHLLRKASFERSQVLPFANGDENILTINVPCLEINELTAQYFPDKNLTLLALDVEGHEWEILSKLDFTAFRIQAVLFETWNLGNRKGDLLRLLEGNGYKIKEAEGDALAIKVDS